jgi:hypothetical protein
MRPMFRLARLKSDIKVLVTKRWVIMGNSDFQTKLAKADEMRIKYYAVSSSEDATIAAWNAKPYIEACIAFLSAVRDAYPELDIEAFFDVWLNCNEDVQYCAEYAKRKKQYELDVRNFCVINHGRYANNSHHPVCYMPLEKYESDELGEGVIGDSSLNKA